MSDELIVARHRVRIYPTPEQVAQLEIEFEATRVCWNKCVEMARHAREVGAKHPGYAGFNKALTEWRKTTDWAPARQASRMACSAVSFQVDKAFAAFFRRAKAGETPGYPKFKKAGRLEGAAEYPISTCTWSANTGALRLPKHKTTLPINWDKRGIPDNPTTVTVLRDRAGRWFASFVVRRTLAKLPYSDKVCGIDMGVAKTMTLHTGEALLAPTDALTPAQKKRFKRLERKRARQKLGSASREKTKLALAKYHARIADVRKSWQDKVTTDLIRTYGFIAIEDLNLRAMVRRPKVKTDAATGRALPNGAKRKSGLNKALHGSALGGLRARLEYKAQWYGRVVKPVKAAYTSQTCPECGTVDAANRPNQATFQCVSCGHKANADHNAAINILISGLLPEFA